MAYTARRDQCGGCLMPTPADLLNMLQPTNGQYARVFLVHGESNGSEVLADKLRKLGYPEVTVAERGMKVSF